MLKTVELSRPIVPLAAPQCGNVCHSLDLYQRTTNDEPRTANVEQPTTIQILKDPARILSILASDFLALLFYHKIASITTHIISATVLKVEVGRKGRFLVIPT
jgi:hypothetical protein